MLFVSGPLLEQGPLHVLTGAGWNTMVAGGADHAENLPLVKEDLVPPLHLGLAQGGSRAHHRDRYDYALELAPPPPATGTNYIEDSMQTLAHCIPELNPAKPLNSPSAALGPPQILACLPP